MTNHLNSIILPYYNHWDLTHARMMELYKFAPENCEIIMVNDASPDLDCHTGAGWWQKQTARHKIKYIRNPENLGFGGSHNRGAKSAEGDILIFLSNDVIIRGPFVEDIERIIDEKNGEVLIGGRILNYDTGWNVLQVNGKPSIVCYPEGWLVACTKAMWKRIGGFDPIYGHFDYEDVDLGAWAIHNDVPMIGLNNPKLVHLSGQTINALYPERMKMTLENQVKFRAKWTPKLEEKYE